MPSLSVIRPGSRAAAAPLDTAAPEAARARSRRTSSTAPCMSTATGCPVGGRTTARSPRSAAAARASSGSACTSPTPSRSPASPTRSACTSWRSRTPCTPTSARSWSATTTRCSWSSRRSATSGTPTPTTANEIVETGEVMVFVGPDFVVTVRHGEHSGAPRRPPQAGGRPRAAGPRPRRRAARGGRPRSSTPTWRSPRAVEDDIDEHGGQVFTPRSRIGRRADLRDEARGARAAPRGRPAGHAAAQAHRGLQRAGPARGPLVLPRRRRPPRHRRRAGRRVRRAAHHAASTRSWRRSRMQQNNDMRKITAYAAIITVPTMIAGIYGMNFDYMPELHWPVRLPGGAPGHRR